MRRAMIQTTAFEARLNRATSQQHDTDIMQILGSESDPPDRESQIKTGQLGKSSCDERGATGLRQKIKRSTLPLSAVACVAITGGAIGEPIINLSHTNHVGIIATDGERQSEFAQGALGSTSLGDENLNQSLTSTVISFRNRTAGHTSLLHGARDKLTCLRGLTRRTFTLLRKEAATLCIKPNRMLHLIMRDKMASPALQVLVSVFYSNQMIGRQSHSQFAGQQVSYRTA